MRKGRNFVMSVALATVCALPAMAETKPAPETVVATVNGENITLGHMIVAYATLPQQYQQLPPDVLYKAILDQLVQQTALTQAHTGDVPLLVTLSLDNERRSLLAAEEIERVLAKTGDEAEIQALYDETFSEGFGGTEYNASHILVESEEEAAAIKAELDKGTDFATLAREKSTGPSGPSGGALGWFGQGAMVPEFEAAVIALEPGQVSPPVQTQFGWHVVKLNESRQSSAPDLESVRGELVNQLRQKAVQARVDELTAAAKVERIEVEGLNPEILRDLDLVRK